MISEWLKHEEDRKRQKKREREREDDRLKNR
jgi:hypothetical protein